MKRAISTILSLILAMSCLSGFAFAAKPADVAEKQVYDAVEKANEKIEKKIEKATEKANENNDEHLAEKLVAQTDKIAEQTTKKAESNGAVLECEYEEVLVGDEVVLVDPLRVIFFPR